MATRTMKWSEENGYLTCEHLDIDEQQEFCMADLFTEFESMSKVEKYLVVYGCKQVMADSCARKKDETLTGSERMTQIQEKWDLWLTGEYKTESTGSRKVGVKKDDFVNTWNSSAPAEKELLYKLFKDECDRLGLTIEVTE